MSPAEWNALLVRCSVKPSVAALWSVVFSEEAKPELFRAGTNDLDEFVGQILHESAGLTVLVEDLNYSAQRLMEVWPSRFPSAVAAAPCAYNPEALANRVYGGRMGNIEQDDGWRYRGRSPIQITGKANYVRVGGLMGQDLDVMPELLEQPRFALEACIHWWEDRIPDSMLGDPEKIRMRVNGSLRGLAETEHFASLARSAMA
jgi:putative chitinase